MGKKVIADTVLRVLDVSFSVLPPIHKKRKQLCNRIQFFLKLNREYGRKDQFTLTEFINVIISAKQDTAAVFFFLSPNQTIFREVARNQK